jgi:hypothetical protein
VGVCVEPPVADEPPPFPGVTLTFRPRSDADPSELHAVNRVIEAASINGANIKLFSIRNGTHRDAVITLWLCAIDFAVIFLPPDHAGKGIHPYRIIRWRFAQLVVEERSTAD